MMGNEAVYECPVSLITPFSWGLIEVFWACHNVLSGVDGPTLAQWCWPYAGSLMNQPFYVVQAFQVGRLEFFKIAAELRPVKPPDLGTGNKKRR